jgi:O-antigen ligase
MSVHPQTFTDKMDRWAGWAAAGLGFSIPISTAADDILLAVILAFWLIGSRFREKIGAVRDNPLVLPAMTLLGMYVIGLIYGAASWGDAADSLKKAGNLLLIPILLPLFGDEKIRRWAIGGFLASMVLTLLISYLLWVGVIPVNGLLKGTQEEPCVFKYRLTHSFLMAFGAYLFALKARLNGNRAERILFALLGVAALYNVLFIVESRTGYIVALVLGAYFLVSGWRWQGVAAATALILILCGAVYLLPASAPHQRLKLMVDEATQWQPGRPENTSVGSRLEYYRNSVELIGQHPVIGSGTGGFKGAYAALVKGTGMEAAVNPHNEYLMVMVQLGVVGLALLLWLFLVQWWKAAALPSGFERLAARGVVLLILSASLVTSTLIDHTEGLFYVWMSALLFASWPVARGREGRKTCHCPSS